ncbi:Glycine--tRNA ligase alpha subunit [Candidatus Bealeia paramacronuclearis]|uniref:Glycine--tRNA ligase alpha subunit n=1 Tax=Candidatus Bealeia paramacronuclearis TaxID=1921001 RepID=A0ABZ2C3W2_9PROT|nr:Glycine--tRNA ligase alpha subunit [Candidatus Bealeia paramacronuclearis]
MRLDFQSVILKLQEFWSKQGCVILQPYDGEVGAGTFHPATTLKSLGPKPWRCAYVQPSRRPTDGRYGENPNRLYRHHQYQVLLKPAPHNIQDLYLQSLKEIGIDTNLHDLRFVEDDWESPTLGAAGLGWEVWCDGQEVTQFTYFQQMGGFPCESTPVELTYGLERLIMILQGVENVYDLDWNGAEGDKKMTYGDVCHQMEAEFSAFSFEHADAPMLLRHFEDAETMCLKLLDVKLVLPAYEYCLKASHLFNLLDAHGVVSVTERANYIGRVRTLARTCCELWMEGVSQNQNTLKVAHG